MTKSNRRPRALAAAALCATSMVATIAWAQQSGAQKPQAPARDDPATSGAGPTSGAPGQMEQQPRPGEPPATTDSRGVTTTSPKAGDAKPDARRDQGNESADTVAPKPQR